MLQQLWPKSSGFRPAGRMAAGATARRAAAGHPILYKVGHSVSFLLHCDRPSPPAAPASLPAGTGSPPSMKEHDGRRQGEDGSKARSAEDSGAKPGHQRRQRRHRQRRRTAHRPARRNQRQPVPTCQDGNRHPPPAPAQWCHFPRHALHSPSCRSVVAAQGSAAPRVPLAVRIASPPFPSEGVKLSSKDRPRAPLSSLLLLWPAGRATRGSGKMALAFLFPKWGRKSDLSSHHLGGSPAPYGQLAPVICGQIRPSSSGQKIQSLTPRKYTKRKSILCIKKQAMIRVILLTLMTEIPPRSESTASTQRTSCIPGRSVSL